MTNVLAFPVTAAARPRRLPDLFRLWSERRRGRADLRRLLATSPHLLADIGLSPGAAVLETEKPFWRA